MEIPQEAFEAVRHLGDENLKYVSDGEGRGTGPKDGQTAAVTELSDQIDAGGGYFIIVITIYSFIVRK